METSEGTIEAKAMLPQLGKSAATFSCPLRRDQLVSSFCEVISSALPALDPVVEKAMEAVKSLPCAPEELDAVELALREAVANAILHGNQGDPARKVIVAAFCDWGDPGGLLLVIRDEGLGFDPAAIPDPTTAKGVHSTHGRGIFLMRQTMDDVRYENGGSEVQLRKH